MTELVILRTFYFVVQDILLDPDNEKDAVVLEKIEKAYNKTFSRLK